jgi:hypothetical protein
MKRLLSKIIYTEEDLVKFISKNRLRVVEADIKTVLKITGGRADLCESILLSTKEIIYNLQLEGLVKYFKIKVKPKVASLSNYQARIWYTWKKTGIEKEIRNISNFEKKAMKAFDLRNQYRTETRKYMKDRVLAEYLEAVEKNMEWEEILTKTLNKKGINTLEEAYYDIIEKSMSGRDGVDKLYKLK